ncbi:MAG TPA: aminotransferase class I/II-fold pyridoxal phosphate-dependent enzyme [Chloroflexia bacterium]|nr:aminotransferase class I/II-fold pyridoxal phosphate-dependent enzyme [Chloroflexia bacterium]
MLPALHPEATPREGPWSSHFYHALVARLCGLTAVAAPLAEETGYALAWDQLAPHLTPRTRAVLFSTPSNPTGAVAERAAITRCAPSPWAASPKASARPAGRSATCWPRPP